MTAGGYTMLIVSWSSLLILAGWCLVLLLRAESTKPMNSGKDE